MPHARVSKQFRPAWHARGAWTASNETRIKHRPTHRRSLESISVKPRRKDTPRAWG